MMHLSKALCVLLVACLAGTSLAHEDDLKQLHRKPGWPGSGFQNAALRTGVAARDLGPNGQLATTFPASRVTLLAWLTLEDLGASTTGTANVVWGHVSPSGREYALVGLHDGITVVDITVPNQPVVVTTVPGPAHINRDIRTYQNYAYSVSEGGNGIQVIDLTLVEFGIVTHVRYVDDFSLGATHTIEIDAERGYLYRTGGGTHGVRIYELNTDPSDPQFVDFWSDRYLHEVTVVNYSSGPLAGESILYACGGFDFGWTQSALVTLNVTDPMAVTQIDTETWPLVAYAHQTWPSADGQYLYVNDEFISGPAKTIVMDVSDPADPTYVSTFTNGLPSKAHNLYVAGNQLYCANYTSGLRVWDTTNPTLPTEVAWFDTDPDTDDPTLTGLWMVNPFFGDDRILGSHIEKGLFIWHVGDPLLTYSFPSGAPTAIDPAGASVPLQITELQAGDYASGTATLHFDDGGGLVSIPLTDLGDGDFEVPFPATACGARLSWYVTADSTDGTVWTEPAGAPSVVHDSLSAIATSHEVQDDFEVDLGWTTAAVGASTGLWERGVPVDDRDWPYDPPADADGSGRCWLTGNVIGDSDVDGGAVQLSSPGIDMSAGPIEIEYSYWLDIKDASAGDGAFVEIAPDGASWTQIAAHVTDGANTWRNQRITQDDLDTAGVVLGPTMFLRFTVVDAGPENIVEGGLDALEVRVAQCSTGTGFCSGDGSGPACPCANQGAPGRGCDNSAGTGGVLLTGSGDPAGGFVVLHGTGFPTGGNPTAVVIRSPLPGASPPFFGDGVLCLAPPVVRMSAAAAFNGSSNHPINHGAGAGTYRYQLWYRNTPAFCTPDGFNLSNGYAIEFP